MRQGEHGFALVPVGTRDRVGVPVDEVLDREPVQPFAYFVVLRHVQKLRQIEMPGRNSGAGAGSPREPSIRRLAGHLNPFSR